MEARRRAVIIRFLERSQSRTLERIIDQLSRYSPKKAVEIIEEVVDLAKQGKLSITKTNDGFKYKANDVNRKQKGETTE